MSYHFFLNIGSIFGIFYVWFDDYAQGFFAHQQKNPRFTTIFYYVTHSISIQAINRFLRSSHTFCMKTLWLQLSPIESPYTKFNSRIRWRTCVISLTLWSSTFDAKNIYINAREWIFNLYLRQETIPSRHN